MTTHSLSVDGELQAGGAQYRRASGGCFTLPDGTLLCDAPSVTVVQPFAALALDVQDRVLRVGREDENLFVEMDGNLRFGVREAYRDDGSWHGAWLSAWIAVAVAHRTPSLTLRASFGVAPPLRTALHRTLPVIPFVRVLFPPGDLELRLTINLDEPHGPTLVGADQVWAIALRGGAAWDG